MGQRDTNGGRLEAWEFGNPADVAERRESQERAALVRAMAKRTEQDRNQATRERMRELVLGKGAGK
jgi:hypothetical protein